MTGTAALAAGALTTLGLLFPTPESGVGSDLVVRYAALTALLTALWWAGAFWPLRWSFRHCRRSPAAPPHPPGCHADAGCGRRLCPV